MTYPAPLPIRIKVPTHESMDLTTMRDISTKVEGLLHLEPGQLVLEWAVSRQVQEFGFSGISDEVEEFEPEAVALPLEWLAGATLAGGILSPRVVLRAASLRVFEGIPGAKGARLNLYYARSDRMAAVAMVRAIETALQAPQLDDSGETPRLTP